MSIDYKTLTAFIEGLNADGSLSDKDYNKIVLYILANGNLENSPRDLIQIRRGNLENLPVLAQAELALTLDTEELYAGGIGGNVNLSRNPSFINVKQFGARGNGVKDDTRAIQKALDSIPEGGTIFFPAGTYLVNSLNPEQDDSFLVCKYSNIKIEGIRELSKIVSGTTPATNLMLLATGTQYLSFENISFIGKNCSYCINGTNGWHPYLYFNKVKLSSATECNLAVSTYVSTFIETISTHSKTAFLFPRQNDSQCTSINMTTCYANFTTVCAYNVQANYSSFSNCACDHANIGWIANAYACSWNSCGFEQTSKLYLFNSFRGVSIDTAYVYQCGGTELAPTDYLLEFVSGIDATICGIRVEDSSNFNYKLGLTNSAFGFENINVTDGSVGLKDIFYVKNYQYTHPILLTRAEIIDKPTVVDVPVGKFHDLYNIYSNCTLNDDLTFQLADGEHVLPRENYYTFKHIKGSGRFIIAGNKLDNTLVNIKPKYRSIDVRSTPATIYFKDLSITNNYADSTQNLVTTTSAKVVLRNVKLFNSLSPMSSAGYASQGGSIYLIGGTTAFGTYRTGANSDYVWSSDVEGCIHFPYATQATLPTSGVWPIGAKFYLPPGSALSNFLGYVNISSVDPPVFKKFGTITNL